MQYDFVATEQFFFEVVVPTQSFDNNLFKLMILGVKDHAIFALDPQGYIITWNSGAQRIKGYQADEIIGSHFSIFYPEEAKLREHPQFELREALKNGSYEEEGWRIRKNGEHFWANVLITAIFDESGKHVGFAKVTRDLTERKRAIDEATYASILLHTAEETFNLMVSAVKDYAIFVLSPEGYIKTWNVGAERIKGYKASEILGKHFSIFYTEQAKAIKHPEFELAEARRKGSFEEEGWRVRKDGSQIWVSVTITRVVDKGGNLTGFVKVTRDLTEKKRNETALEQARDEALLANQLKTKFVANVTHEIRTPLSGIVGLSELIKDDPQSTPNLQDSGTRIFEASKQLLAIVNDLLDIAKLEAGKVEVESVPYDPSTIIDEVRGLFYMAASDKSLSLTVSIENEVPQKVIGDPHKIRQVLLNLVSNAIKFTESGGINLGVALQEDSLLYAVTDTGIGVTDVVKGKLFQPFVQAHESTTRLFGGTGLGLFIAQQFVELMGGTIGLVSDPGEGTTFWFTVPLATSGGADE